MQDSSESVNVHKGDSRKVIEEYEKRGFVLIESTEPSIPAQRGFVQLVFVPAEDAAKLTPQPKVIPKKKRGFLFWR